MRIGESTTHRCYVAHGLAHYAGDLVDGAWGLARFGDVATELCIVGDGDEGLFAGYSRVDFHAPVRAGDVVEARGEVVRVGRRSREISFTLHVLASGARALPEPVLATSATGTVVVP